MGILDRIAGTLDELAGDGPSAAAVREEIALALAQAERGDLADAEARLADVAARFPTLAPAFVHLVRLRARRGALDEAVTAFGKAVDLAPDDGAAWGGLGDALARLGRREPAREALRHALALATDDRLRGQAHAALGRVYGDAAQLGKAVRELGKARDLLGDDAEVELAYGRALARAGEPEGSEWLTRAARRAGADAQLFAEAAAATGDAGLAERLLGEGLLRAPGDATLQAALARHLARTGRAALALEIARASVAANPGSAAALAALREAYAGAARWSDALEVARRETALGATPARATELALALGARDREALAAVAAAPVADEAALASSTGEAGARAGATGPFPLDALRAFLAGDADADALVALARAAPDEAARRFVVGAQALAAPPAGSLVALLAWAHDLAARMPALAGLAAAAGRAHEAFDRPLLIAVMGEFNAGKSSFVNALVGDEVAPTGVTPTTATVNVLRHGDKAGARVVAHDGSVRELGPTSVDPFLRELDDAGAAAVRVVEIFHPLEALRRVEIVDTPGLNSIRPEHDKVARDFLVEADALVWVFAIGQAAKASEKQALDLAHGAGKRVLGVLNKIDGAEPDDVAAVVRHVRATVGPLLEEIVPFSATRALAARRAGRADAALDAVEAALERQFFAHARELKRVTALASLRRFAAAARAAATPPPPVDFAAARDALDALDERLAGALAKERVALRARIDEAYRAAAFEVRDFVRPRAWILGEHRVDAADEQFLVELLEDAVERATEVTRQALRAAVPAPPAEGPGRDAPAGARAAVERAVDTIVDRFAAYTSGVIEGGAVAEFFRHDLPRLKLDPAAIRGALTRRAPDPEETLFSALARELARARRDAHAALDAAEVEHALRGLAHDEHVERPLAALEQALAALGG
jgi:tetratricopeptide (TPR) repeat protein/GTP-binding protein EngB required for normal cell division